MFIKIILLIPFTFSAFADGEEFNLESKIKNDLISMASKIVSLDEFFLTVSSTFTTRRVREVVEGESISQNEENPFKMPHLPGFDLKFRERPEAKRDRQTYKIVEKKTLKSIFIQLSLNNNIPSRVQEQIRTIVSEYLNQNYPGKVNLNFQSITMKKVASKDGFFWQTLLPWILGGIFILALTAMFLSRSKEKIKKISPSEVYPYHKGENEMSDPQYAGAYKHNNYDKFLHSVHGSERVPPLPPSERYIDMRSELLKLFSESSDIFRIYFQNLKGHSRNDIMAALKGPAFSSLLKTLNVNGDLSEDITPPSEESLLFYCKDFKEFIDMHQWQKNQFFGFLHQLTHAQLVTLFKDQNPLIAALMLKFLNPEDAAKILDQFDSDKRIEFLSETSRVEKIPSEELSKIEGMVRGYVESLPKLMLENDQEDSKVWSEILAQAKDQESLLMDIEKVRPELYPSLAKFRFKMEELPSLPTPLISKVLEDSNNEELAMAFAGCPKDIVEFALNELHEKRRNLIESQIASFQGLPPSEIELAKKALVLKFREVMA